MKKVKCYYCEEQFDKDTETWVKPLSNRYAHESCSILYDTIQEKCKNWLLEIYDNKKISRQIKIFVNDGIDLITILQTLEYWYDIKQNSAEESNGGIGIVPYIYKEAISYWTNKKDIQEKAVNLKISESPIKTIKLKRQPVKKPVNIDFFDLR